FRAGDLPPLPLPTPRVEAPDSEDGAFGETANVPAPPAGSAPPTTDDDPANERQAKDFGTLVHAALELWQANLSAESAVRRAAVRHPELATHVGEAVELVERVLRDPAFEPIRAAVAGERGRLLREVPFLLANADADAAAGTIDALLEEPDGALVILDWKTGHPPAAAAARQAATYANAVEQLTGRAPREVRFLLLSRSPIGVLSLAPEQISPT
ncbi:MAG: PD-(D/E)XK nuclease family protein, partial [Gemmatimonadetes bacterium]|nr:PD-(D/E)XK nuclease family protein [Gemmatimonadota bacterium]